jgi:hypothetical protein
VTVNQCSILYVHDGSVQDPPVTELKMLGFAVTVTNDLPADDVLTPHHALVVRARADCPLTMLAARLRAKPRFGRRVLIALVPETTPDRARREAVMSGFDSIKPVTCSERDLAASILRVLRAYPELRCFLRSPGGRRKAA